jgi:hypothetical protein
MGTSAAYEGMPGNPNWTNLSRTMTTACGNDVTNDTLQKIVGNFVTLAHSINNSSNGGHGSGSSSQGTSGGGIGRSGTRTAQRLGGLLSKAKKQGLSSALAGLGFSGGPSTPASHVYNYLLEHCAGVAVTIDDTAAKAAVAELLDELGGSAETLQELEDNFKSQFAQKGLEELLSRFFGYYIYQHLCTALYEKLVKDKGRSSATRIYTELKDYILETIKGIAQKRKLESIDWEGNEGQKVVDTIFKETLGAFADYED